MPVSISSNDSLLALSFIEQGAIRANAVIRLFRNNIVPTPATQRGDFVEADYPGYVVKLPATAIIGPRKIVDGGYQFGFGPYAWASTAPTDQIVYGWYITGGSRPLWYSGVFANPVPMTVGNPLTSAIYLQLWQLQVGCAQ